MNPQVYPQHSSHEERLVSLRCPKCKRTLVDVVYVPRSTTGRCDTIEVFDAQADRAVQEAYDSHTHAEITEARKRAQGEGRPTMQRGAVPEHKDEVLGVLGPRTQARTIRTAEGPRGSRSYQFRCSGRIGRGSCGATPSVRQETLVKLVRDALARGEHRLSLP